MNTQLIPEALQIKLVIIGDPGVGKSTILYTYTTEKFHPGYTPAIFENMIIPIEIEDYSIDLSLFDTGGQDENIQLKNLKYSNADIFIIVFSLADQATFLNAINKWHREIDESYSKIPKLFLGNKTDLRNQANNSVAQEIVVIQNIIQQALQSIQNLDECQYAECSALLQEGIKEAFNIAIKMVLDKKFPLGGTNSRIKKQSHPNAFDKTRKCCCTLI